MPHGHVDEMEKYLVVLKEYSSMSLNNVNKYIF